MPKKRRIKQAIIEVLSKHKNGLHYRVITDSLLATKVQINSKTPWLSVNSLLTRGEEFERISPGVYRLTST